MKHNININELPHGDIIVPNGEINIPSIFMFTEYEELYSFLHGCSKSNCKVHFENEDIDVIPNEQSTAQSVKMFCYTSIMANRKIGNDYVRYLGNLDKMKW